MRAVITGGTGFIGSHLVDALVARGDNVLCIRRPGPARGWPLAAGACAVDCGFQDHTRLSAAIEGADVVFHIAGRTHGLAADLYSSNAGATARIMRAAAALGGVAPHVILTSSIAAVGPCRDGSVLHAKTFPAPISRYGRSKLAAEDHVFDYGARMPTTILRLPSVYGPRERALLRLINWIAHGFAITIGSWEREASLIYIRDAVQGMLAAANRPPERPTTRLYYLSHPVPTSWSDFAATVARALGRAAPLRLSLPRTPTLVLATVTERIAAWRGRASRLNRDRVDELSQTRWVCDPSDAMREISFAPSYSLEAGMRETVHWYRAMHWI